MRRVSIILALLCSMTLVGQSESSIELSFETYMRMVEENHPLLAAADLQLERGEAILRAARGGFDPVLYGSLNQKDLEGKRYYDLLSSGLKIPTWSGVTVEAGYDDNEGLFLNPSDFTPRQGLLSAGLSLSIGQGLFIDERRAQLRKAQISKDMASAQRQLLVNDLFLEAGTAYWKWFSAYHVTTVYEEAVDIAILRKEGVIQSATLGDRPYIDTLEAGIQVQNRVLNLQQAQLELANAAAGLAVYLWLDGYIPMELASNTSPINLSVAPIEKVTPQLMRNLDSLVASHPVLQMEMAEISRSEIDRRWKAEQLKPTVDLKYRALNEAIGGSELSGFNAQDYALGLQVKMPILFRKERAGLDLAKLKIEERKLKVTDKRQALWLKARKAVNTQNTTADQAKLLAQNVTDYDRLLNGERDLFSIGESSLFLVNSRELGYMKAKIKHISSVAKNRLAMVMTNYALSRIDQNRDK